MDHPVVTSKESVETVAAPLLSREDPADTEAAEEVQ
jgi:hypothetical protein